MADRTRSMNSWTGTPGSGIATPRWSAHDELELEPRVVCRAYTWLYDQFKDEPEERRELLALTVADVVDLFLETQVGS